MSQQADGIFAATPTYVLNGSLEAEYVTYGAPLGGSNTLFGELENAYSFGGGIGYQVTKHLRADLTADYFSSAKFTGSTTGGPCGIGGAVRGKLHLH